MWGWGLSIELLGIILGDIIGGCGRGVGLVVVAKAPTLLGIGAPYVMGSRGGGGGTSSSPSPPPPSNSCAKRALMK